MGENLVLGIVASLIAAGLIWVGAWAVRRWLTRQKRGWVVPKNPELFAQTHILVIDDLGEEELAHMKQLRNRGFHVDRWDRVIAERAMKLELSFDLLLLDNRGVVDGYGAESGAAAAKLLRRDNPWIPMFLFTSFPEDLPPAEKRALTQMGVGLMPKTTRFVELEERVVNALTTV